MEGIEKIQIKEINMYCYRFLLFIFFLLLVSCRVNMAHLLVGDLSSQLYASGTEVHVNQASYLNAGVRRDENKNKNGIQYTGFAKDFMPVKEALVTGNIENLQDIYQQRLGEGQNIFFALDESNLGVLSRTELADLYLLKGDTKNAIKSFSVVGKDFLGSDAEPIIERETIDFFGWVEGSREKYSFGEYTFKGFEKVMTLNLKAVAYILEGDRDSYFASQQAIDLQDKLRADFFLKVKKNESDFLDFQENIRQHQVLEQRKIAANKLISNNGYKAAEINGVLNMTQDINKYFLSADRQGAILSSAYVNPFGDYIKGIVQEFNSLKNKALKSYRKAKELNLRSAVLTDNVQALMLKRPMSKNKRLIHFVVADGFAPEKKVLQYKVSAGNGSILIKVPIYESSKLALAHRILIKAIRGKKEWGQMSVVSNVDALCLRTQKDSRAKDLLDLSTGVAKVFLEKKPIKEIDDEYFLTKADTRSWLTLPASLLATRLEIPRSVKQVRFVAYDRKLRRIIDKVVDLPDGNGFMYARVIGKAIYLNKSKALWNDG